MTDTEAWQRARRMLCVRLDNLGDVVMTSPALRALKESRPGREITLLASPSGARAAGLIPAVDETLVFEAPWMKSNRADGHRIADREIIERVRAGAYDAAVIFTVFTQSPFPAAYLAYLAEIPLRLAICRENPYRLLTDWVAESDMDVGKGVRHEVRRQLDLVKRVGCETKDERLSIKIPVPAREQVMDWLACCGLDLSNPWILVSPGASAPSRRYPAEGFAAVADGLIGRHGFQVVFAGTADEMQLVESIRDQMDFSSFSAAGEFDLAEYAALISQAPIALCNNSGPAHLAAAAGTPVVDLYALTNPQHTPWRVPSRVLFHDVPCKNCFKSVCPMGHQDCLRKVEPEAVVDAVLGLFDSTRVRGTEREGAV